MLQDGMDLRQRGGGGGGAPAPAAGPGYARARRRPRTAGQDAPAASAADKAGREECSTAKTGLR